MMSYDQLRTLSFRLPEGKPLKPQTFQILKFPEKWKSELRNLQAEITRRPVDKTNVPISSLNKALRALVPDLIYITPNAAKSNVQPWLYSAMPIDIPALYLIFNAWVRTQFDGKASEKQITALLKKMPAKDLEWEERTVDVGTWTTVDNGTAKLGGDNSFILLPHVLAAKLSQDNISLEYGSDLLRFRRAPLSIGSKGAELVSWPPLDYPDKRSSWYWSVVITFTLQTVPFQSFPVLHCDLSLRRWGSMPIEFLPSDKETNVYLLTEVPWLKNLPYSNSFQVAPIRWEKVPASEGHKDKSEYRVTWGSNLVRLLDWLKVGDRFPTPQNIKDNPESTLNLNNDNPTAALLFRYGINPKHGVGPGLSPADRRQLAEQIAKLIAPEWEFVELLQRVKFKSEVPTNIFLPDSKAKKKTNISELKALRVRAIRQAVGDSLTLEIWYQNETKRAGLINAIRESLGIPDSASFPYKFADLNFTLNLRYQPLGALGDKLEIDSGIKDEKDRRRQAIRKRGKEVAEKIEQASANAPLAQSKVTGALIELDGADRKDFANNADPKYALRRGFALCDRVTQFISTELDKLSHRATSSFLDLLRQLEVQPACPNIVIKKHSLPDKINYVGLWWVKHNSQTSADGSTQRVPVMVYMASDTTEIKAIAPGFDDQWLPYREALLKIGKEKIKGFKRPEEAMLKFIKPKLHDVIYQDRSPKDTVLFCHAQNLRHAWKWLNNGNIALDMVFFGKEKPQPINRYFPGLRIVRIRDSQSRETPEWYAQNKLLAEKDKEQGWAQGIFKMGDRVFASTYNKPKQFQNLSPKQSKVSPWTTVNKTTKEEHVHAPSPDTYFWNPGLVELTVACLQPGDDPFPWAALTHELRHIALQYDEPLKLPLPLHLAKQIEEYVLLMENEDIEDE